MKVIFSGFWQLQCMSVYFIQVMNKLYDSNFHTWAVQTVLALCMMTYAEVPDRWTVTHRCHVIPWPVLLWSVFEILLPKRNLLTGSTFLDSFFCIFPLRFFKILKRRCILKSCSCTLRKKSRKIICLRWRSLNVQPVKVPTSFRSHHIVRHHDRLTGTSPSRWCKNHRDINHHYCE